MKCGWRINYILIKICVKITNSVDKTIFLKFNLYRKRLRFLGILRRMNWTHKIQETLWFYWENELSVRYWNMSLQSVRCWLFCIEFSLHHPLANEWHLKMCFDCECIWYWTSKHRECKHTFSIRSLRFAAPAICHHAFYLRNKISHQIK